MATTTSKKKEARPYSMKNRERQLPVGARTFAQWKNKLRHGDKQAMADQGIASISWIKKIFREQRATRTQVRDINAYFESR